MLDTYSLDCSYFEKECGSLAELVSYCSRNAMDPGYEITKNGIGIGEKLIDFIVY